ncbi:host attachment protein [Candidatus Filomicrobium marinum]|nr:host attachment protein [Candidatus Filomicrobium marinum]
MNRTRTWLLIADASRALVFENAGDRDAVAEIEDLSLSTELPMTRELLEDKPGRTFESVGSGRHAKEEPTDSRRHLKREFAGTVIDALRDAMVARRFDRLVLIAPPAFLGDLRAKLPKDLEYKVVHEVALDLTKLPKRELCKRLSDILEQGS